MPTNLTDSATYTSQIQVPIDTDPFELDGLVLAYQQLANRAAYLKANALISGETFTSGKTINAGANSLTFSGTTGPFSVTRSGAGNISVTTAAGDITIDSGNDLTINAGNNASLITGNDCIVDVGADLTVDAGGLGITLPGAAWPGINSRTVTDYALRSYPFLEDATEWSMTHDFAGSHLTQDVSAARLFFHITPPAGATINSVTMRMQSKDLPAAGMPTTLPSAELWATTFAGSSTQLVNTTNDTSANVAAYATWHSIVMTPASPYVVPEGGRLYVVFNGAVHGSDVGRFVKVMAPFCSVTVTVLRPI